MRMRALRRIGFGLLPALLCLGPLPRAAAGVLYKCAAEDGSTAYVSSRSGYRSCSVVASFPDAPAAKPAPKTAPPRAASARAPSSGWSYEENRADFTDVMGAAAVHPATAARADFRAVLGSVQSTARRLEPVDFSAVVAEVSSSARMPEPPLYIAAPYRMRAPNTTEPLSPIPAAASAARPSPIPAAASAARPSAPRVLRGAVYRVARAGGITEYTNVRPAQGKFAVLFTYIATCIACDLRSTIDFAHTALNFESFKDSIARAAADYGVDRALLRAVIHAESAFNPLAVSRKGAQGLMQLMPATADDLGVADAFDAEQNIRGGAAYLSQLMQLFEGDTRLATAAYNAGPNAVRKYGGVPPYDETRVYVERVATLQDRYRKAEAGPLAAAAPAPEPRS